MSVDWKGKGGVVSEGMEFEKLDTTKEYVLKLVEVEYIENVTMRFKDEVNTVDRFKTVWQVENHSVKVWLTFNLPLGFLHGAAPVSEKSNIVRFARRFRSVEPGKSFHLDDHFFIDRESGAGMRIRARLTQQKDSDFYNVDFESIGPVTPQATEPKADPDALMLKLLGEYDTSDEAMQAFMKFLPDEPISKFWLLWNKLQAAKAGPPTPAGEPTTVKG